MKTRFDNQILKFPCPSCGSEIKQKIAWFKKDNNCTFCDMSIKSDELSKALDSIEKESAKFERDIGKMKFKL